MGRKSREKKQRVQRKTVRSASSGYFGMGLLGIPIGLGLGLVFGKTPLWLTISVFITVAFMLFFNYVLLFFGFGPNSGATSSDASVPMNLVGSSGVGGIGGGSSSGSSGGTSSAGGGGGGSAG